MQLDDPEFPGGANRFSLRESQANFRAFGACERRLVTHVRPPREDEIPPEATQTKPGDGDR